MKRHDHLGTRRRIAGNVPRKRVHVGDQLRLVLCRSGSTHAAPKGNAHAGNFALEGTQAQLRRLLVSCGLIHQIESCPIDVVHSLEKTGRRIGQNRQPVIVGLSQSLNLPHEQLVIYRYIHNASRGEAMIYPTRPL